MKFMWYQKFRCCFNRRVSILKMSNVRKKVGKIVLEKWFLGNRKIHFNRIPSHTFFPLFASLAFPLIGLDEVVLSLFLRIFVWDFLLSTPLSLGIFDFQGCLILGPFSALRVKENQFLRAIQCSCFSQTPLEENLSETSLAPKSEICFSTFPSTYLRRIFDWLRGYTFTSGFCLLCRGTSRSLQEE